MGASTAARNTQQQSDVAIPPFVVLPVKAASIIYQGVMVGRDSTGYAVMAGNASSSAQVLIGRSEGPGNSGSSGDVDNSAGASGAKDVRIRQGVFKWSNLGDVTQAMVGLICYASDDHTVTRDDGAGLRPIAGVIEQVDADGVWVQMGLTVAPLAAAASPTAIAAATAALFKARAVITVALAAYTAAAGVITANANGAIGAVADGVTLVNGDLVFLPEGIAAAAKDAGPYVVTSIGSGGSKFVLTRPDWYATGSLIQQGVVIDIGPEGAVYEGSQWKSFVTTATKVVDTDAPLFWPRNFRKTVTLVAGTVTLGGSDFLALRSTTKSMVEVTRNTPNTSTATTGGYQCAVANRTAGAIGTGALTIIAAVAAGTINNADISTLDVLVTNW